jgi:hypothetical protein
MSDNNQAKSSKTKPQDLKVARLLMVVSSFSPLFLLWAIRGTKLIEDIYFTPLCAILIFLPNLILGARIWYAIKKEGDTQIHIDTAEDHREFLLVYLFAILLPMYVIDLDTARNFWASVIAMLFIIFLFWHMDLYYMNLVFALLGYRVYTIKAAVDSTKATDMSVRILISKRETPPKGNINAYRISNSVFFERS